MGTLDHIRWIGGGTGAGKSAAASRLSERFGLSVYASDATIQVHSARLSESTAPLLQRFRHMSMNERWVLRSPDSMYRTFPWFHGEGFNLLIEDLRRLPVTQVALVEGFRLLPHLVRPYLADKRHAVWLMPTPEFQRNVFALRTGAEAFWMDTSDPRRALANVLERDQMFAKTMATEAADHGLSTLRVDGGDSLDRTVNELATCFGLLR
ncbi:MAG: hypothetical protein WA880_06335 [Ornithinimicrobium sp.]